VLLTETFELSERKPSPTYRIARLPASSAKKNAHRRSDARRSTHLVSGLLMMAGPIDKEHLHLMDMGIRTIPLD
jgi:hypothetical protein